MATRIQQRQGISQTRLTRLSDQKSDRRVCFENTFNQQQVSKAVPVATFALAFFTMYQTLPCWATLSASYLAHLSYVVSSKKPLQKGIGALCIYWLTPSWLVPPLTSIGALAYVAQKIYHDTLFEDHVSEIQPFLEIIEKLTVEGALFSKEKSSQVQSLETLTNMLRELEANKTQEIFGMQSLYSEDQRRFRDLRISLMLDSAKSEDNLVTVSKRTNEHALSATCTLQKLKQQTAGYFSKEAYKPSHHLTLDLLVSDIHKIYLAILNEDEMEVQRLFMHLTKDRKNCERAAQKIFANPKDVKDLLSSLKQLDRSLDLYLKAPALIREHLLEKICAEDVIESMRVCILKVSDHLSKDSLAKDLADSLSDEELAVEMLLADSKPSQSEDPEEISLAMLLYYAEKTDVSLDEKSHALNFLNRVHEDFRKEFLAQFGKDHAPKKIRNKSEWAEKNLLSFGKDSIEQSFQKALNNDSSH